MRNRSIVTPIILIAFSSTIFALYWGMIAKAQGADQAQTASFQVLDHPSISIQPNTPLTRTIDICSQHAPKCALDEDTWAGEEGAWQFTGKKWVWHSGTPKDRKIAWEWSRPYPGSNPDYIGKRENHYSNFSKAPNDSPDFWGTGPYTYDWELWLPEESNNRFLQYAGHTEYDAYHIGEHDCESGVYFPVIDQDVDYAYTPLAVQVEDRCVTGGYIVTYRTELWDEPLSETRIQNCDDFARGIPSSDSPKGNLICKLSPYVGVVYQTYAWGDGLNPGDPPALGCEGVVYAWGWEKPAMANSGQDYEAYFRNGELRYTRWIDLTGESAEVPPPDDFDWWTPRCETSWSEINNVLYSGVYKVGSTVYTDTIALPYSVVAEIPPSGGGLVSPLNQITFTFPAETFTETVLVTQTLLTEEYIPPTGSLLGINRFYTLAAGSENTGRPIEPSQPYTVTIQYSDSGLGAAIEDTLALYLWRENQWKIEATSSIFTTTNTIIATPDQLGTWGVLGETERVYLPFIQK
jgi:hypothetical protein